MPITTEKKRSQFTDLNDFGMRYESYYYEQIFSLHILPPLSLTINLRKIRKKLSTKFLETYRLSFD